MRYLLTLPAGLALLPTDALAHAGHIADLGGHDHWVLGVGLGVIAGAAVLGWLKGGKKDEDVGEDIEAEDDAEGEPA